MQSILSKTTNLVTLYQHLCGESEVPKEFHFFSFLSLLAAVVGDRVWVEKVRGEKLKPNLYIFLVGPSGSGKGVAINRVFKLLDESVGTDLVKTYKGRTTAAHFVDFLGKQMTDEATGERFIPNPVTWLITEELARNIGKGLFADDFIKLMTEIYSGSPLVDDGTRTHGHVRLRNPCVNWLAGTTKEWMVESLTGDNIRSGFGARVCFVNAGYVKKRYVRPKYPSDYQEVWEHIKARLVALYHITPGKFWITPEAAAKESTWYMNRKWPEDERLWPSWKRQQDIMLKIAMLLALGNAPPLVIEEGHIVQAVKLSTWMLRNAELAVELATRTPMIDYATQVEEALRREQGVVKHTPFSRKMSKRGIDSRTLNKILADLSRDGLVRINFTKTGARTYRWIGSVDDSS
jgi:hypothetical protein